MTSGSNGYHNNYPCLNGQFSRFLYNIPNRLYYSECVVKQMTSILKSKKKIDVLRG